MSHVPALLEDLVKDVRFALRTFRRSPVLTAAGLVAGSAAALATTRLVSSLLFGLSPNDPAVLLGVIAVLAGTCAVASFGPAWRASRADPMDALRAD